MSLTTVVNELHIVSDKSTNPPPLMDYARILAYAQHFGETSFGNFVADQEGVDADAWDTTMEVTSLSTCVQLLHHWTGRMVKGSNVQDNIRLQDRVVVGTCTPHAPETLYNLNKWLILTHDVQRVQVGTVDLVSFEHATVSIQAPTGITIQHCKWIHSSAVAILYVQSEQPWLAILNPHQPLWTLQHTTRLTSKLASTTLNTTHTSCLLLASNARDLHLYTPPS
jgi:hypothetical protein